MGRNTYPKSIYNYEKVQKQKLPNSTTKGNKSLKTVKWSNRLKDREIKLAYKEVQQVFNRRNWLIHNVMYLNTVAEELVSSG